MSGASDTPPASGPGLVATCWTSAGTARPGDADERSPFRVEDRVRAVAEGGWAGLGLVAADLEDARAGEGLPALAARVRAAGLRHVEVELLDGWWQEGLGDAARRRRWELLLEAASALGAAFVKAAPPPGPAQAGLADLVAPLRRLTAEAAGAGTRLALEPLPWSGVASIPRGAELVRAVDDPGFGLVVDAWHVFRAGTSLEELAAALTPGAVLGVELDDADPTRVGTPFEDTRDRRRYPGEGGFDLVGLVHVLRGAGFDGPWGVEVLSDAHRALPLAEALRRAHETALAVLRAAGVGAR